MSGEATLVRVTYRGFPGTYLEPPEAAEAVLEAHCDPEAGGCGFKGEVDAYGVLEDTLWFWTCDCGIEHDDEVDID